jgi:hypothetical protein
VDRPLDPGEMVLIKVSFKNPCEQEDDSACEAVLYRRRVVPLVTRVTRATSSHGRRGARIAARIESMTEEDRRFFMKKYFGQNEEEAFELELEGKHIRFAAN